MSDNEIQADQNEVSEQSDVVGVADNKEAPKSLAGKSAGIWTVITLWVALAALSGCIFLWMQQEAVKKQWVALDTPAMAIKVEQLEKEAKKTQGLKNELKTLQQLYQQLSISFQALQKHQQIKPVEDVRLVEADALLRFAQQRYTLTHDLFATISAMQMAEALLRERSDVALVAVRKQILAEIKLLQGIQISRTDESVSFVTKLIFKADKLPLLSAHPVQFNKPDDENNSGKRKETDSIWKGLLKTMRPLVSIRRTSHKTPAMLSAEDERHVRLILKSRLEQLRLSLLQRNEAGAHVLSQQSRIWLTRYFDTRQQDTIAAIEGLDNLIKLKLDIKYPEIGLAWKQLQQFRKQQQHEKKAL